MDVTTPAHEENVTERKPTGVRWEDWVGRQVRVAQQAGKFDDLPGQGKPLPDLDRPRTMDEWLVDWARREGADLAAALPPSLAFRRERERLPEAVAAQPSEAAVRELAADFNDRLRKAYLRPQAGPPLTVGLLDVEAVVQQWRDARPAPVDPRLVPPAEPRQRHWWGLSRRLRG